MTSSNAAGARRAGQSIPFSASRQAILQVYSQDMTEEVERLRQSFPGRQEYLEERLEEILEHPDDTPEGDRQVRRELKELERELERVAA